MNDLEAIVAMEALAIRLAAAEADAQAIQTVIESHSTDPLVSMQSIMNQMTDQAATQKEHLDMEIRVARASTAMDVQDRITGLKTQLATLQREKQTLQEEARKKRKLEEQDAEEDAPARKTIKKPTFASLSAPVPKKTPAMTKASNGVSASNSSKTAPLRATSSASSIPSAFPLPPAGFANWGELYKKGNFNVLADAQSRSKRGKDPFGQLPTRTYGKVTACKIPCRKCQRLSIPCLLIDEDDQRPPAHGNQRCIYCQEGRGSCIEEEGARKHKYADAVTRYHNACIALGERPGMWMGPSSFSSSATSGSGSASASEKRKVRTEEAPAKDVKRAKR
ncbi:hypothetical protein MKEN_01325000 [Mycena kentingensis (nom. inval.)]|nr:hypothetical protein MKEN_01325000 [Mycena kentingensis (nom. inval.)]